MFMLNNAPLPIDTPFEIDGTHYPSNWLRLTSIEEKNAVGITEVPDPEPYDDRFYWGHDNPKQLDDKTVKPKDGASYVQRGLKYTWTLQIKDTANKLLTPTDWMIIRKVERNVAVPDAVTAYRAAVIAECARIIEAVQNSKTMEEFIGVVTTANWPTNE